MNILIIEDDPIQATKLKLSLRSLGYTDVICASDAHTALDICQNQTVDLIFCDINLPKVDGVHFLATLSRYSSDIGIVIHSAMRENVIELTANMCSAAGFTFVKKMAKPHTLETLAKILHKFESCQTPSSEETTNIVLSEEEVNEAFEKGWFINYYQPQFRAQSHQVIGVEALVRCLHPKYGVLTPISFLATITSMKLLDQLFWVVSEKSIAAISHFSEELNLSINVSQSNLEKNICDGLLSLCAKYQFNPTRLILELTEHEAYDYSVDSLSNLARLSMHGINLSIDDFGTGHASLSQLTLLPFTELKIDRRFIKDLSNNYCNQQLTSMCIQLAHSLGLHCIVEGVEDEETLTYLENLGIDSYQGFYASKPLPIPALRAFIDKQTVECKPSHDQGITWHAEIYSSDSASQHSITKTMEKSELFRSTSASKNLTCLLDRFDEQNIDLLVIDVDFLDSDLPNVYTLLKSTNFMGSICLLEGNKSLDSEMLSGSYHCFIASKNPRYMQTIIHTLSEREKSNIGRIYQLLSTQELNVANMLLKGFNNKKIAYELDLNEKTVSTYKTRVFKKLEIESIIELAQYKL
ncbi:EAL domain-containing protein [Vibrio sinensis]|uniref:EAL domain-containing protein n=1 Tax=Vibrio sinensis TaxID=2302434 RepID=A0A3A6QVH1_9VIBR|nr:EAL domain-containing protein [Vibrio sinensis]RJX75288.1 EAL domain-containing protein [Vibrio sinensis]